MKIILKPPARTQTTGDVNGERDRRLAIGFLYGDNRFQARSMDLINITGAAAAATIAMSQGATAGNLRWANPDSDFRWIAADNSLVPLDAPSMIEMAQQAMGFVAAHVMAARAIKDRIDNGENIQDIVGDPGWP